MAQLKAAIRSFDQDKGYAIPTSRKTRKPRKKKTSVRATTSALARLSTRCCVKATAPTAAPNAVKEYARKNPHSMAEWSQASRTHVSHMHAGDFYHGENPMTLDRARDVKMG